MNRSLIVALCCAMALTVFAVGTAHAIPAFKTEFDKMYVKKDSKDPKEKAFADAAKTAKCNICHVGEKKKDKNAYGKELDELLDKKADAKNKEKIQEALKTVEGKHSKKDDDKSETFGDRIKQGKLPVESAAPDHDHDDDDDDDHDHDHHQKSEK